jgi:hypothetical protein
MLEQQVADAAGVPVTAIRKLRKEGGGPPFVVIGKTKIRYVPQTVRNWLAQRQYTSMAHFYASNAERGKQAEVQRQAAEKVRPMRWRKPEAVSADSET